MCETASESANSKENCSSSRPCATGMPLPTPGQFATYTFTIIHNPLCSPPDVQLLTILEPSNMFAEDMLSTGVKKSFTILLHSHFSLELLNLSVLDTLPTLPYHTRDSCKMVRGSSALPDIATASNWRLIVLSARNLCRKLH